MNDISSNDKLIEKMAEALHQVFYEEMRRLGYIYGPVTDEKKKLHSSLVPFLKLPEDEKEQNRNNARDIQYKIESIGYKIVPSNGGLMPVRLIDEEVEKLAKKEHERWMKQKIDAGWTYAPKTDKTRKLHTGIVSYEQLSEEEKDKDRVLIRSIPKILKQVGYVVVKKVV